MEEETTKSNEPKFSILTASVFPIQKEELERIADETGRSVSDLLREAITVLLSNYKR